MRRKAGSRFLLAAALLFAASCGGDQSTAPVDGGGGSGGGGGGGGDGGGGGTTPQPAAVAVVSGSGQTGRTLEALPNPLVVRVTDDTGAPVSGVTVSWSVSQGDGTLASASTVTGTTGNASNTFTPGATVGSGTIEASVSGVSAPATFDVETSILVIEMRNIAFRVPGGGDAVTVPVGTTVEWVNRDGVSHTATSSSEPGGGSAFDSGLLSQGARFQFVPSVTGTWTYLCEVHPGQMSGATITAQ